MKNIIVLILSFLLIACKKEYILDAHLACVFDKSFDVVSTDTFSQKDTYEFTCRQLQLIYRATNESVDSILIPIGVKYNNPLSAHLQYRDSLVALPIYSESYYSKSKSNICASGDTISIRFNVNISFDKSKEEWLQNISTKELLTKINTSMDLDSTSTVKTNCIIPQIVFYNDTNNISINPPLRIVKKTNK